MAAQRCLCCRRIPPNCVSWPPRARTTDVLPRNRPDLTPGAAQAGLLESSGACAPTSAEGARRRGPALGPWAGAAQKDLCSEGWEHKPGAAPWAAGDVSGGPDVPSGGHFFSTPRKEIGCVCESESGCFERTDQHGAHGSPRQRIKNNDGEIKRREEPRPL